MSQRSEKCRIKHTNKSTTRRRVELSLKNVVPAIEERRSARNE